MKTFNLQEFDGDLRNIIKRFRKKCIIFSREAPFQLELAWALKEAGYDVRLEVLSCSNEEREDFATESDSDKRKTKLEKMYTDIVVDFANNKSVAIELKYKIEADNKKKQFIYEVNGHQNVVFHQGAANNGCYQYLEDVVRLERLVNREIPFDLFNNDEREVVCGYAIILTNGSTYWDEHEVGTELDVFGLRQGKEIKGELQSANQKKYIKLSNKYMCQWEPYYMCEEINAKKINRGRGAKKDKDTPTPFGYLILQIPPKETK